MQVIDLIGKLPKHSYKKSKERKLADITQVVVHHRATESGTPESFARHHVNTLGWPGIGYNYVIARDGVIYKCHPATTVSYHAASANTSGLGICLIGNFETQTLQGKQKDALIWLLKQVTKAYGIKAVIGHRDVKGAKTACPGKHVDMDAIRGEIGL